MYKVARFLLRAMVFAVLVGAVSYASPWNSFPGGRGIQSLRRTPEIRHAKPRPQAQTTSAPTRDQQAVMLANKALNALTGGAAITDARVRANASYVAGSEQESGTAILEGRTGYQSRIVLSLSGGQRTELHDMSSSPPQGKWSGPDGVSQPLELRNCWAEPTWFFPALTVQSALANPQISFAYLGQGTKAGVTVQHVRTSRIVPGQGANMTSTIQKLSQLDMYLDANSSLPVAVSFSLYPVDVRRGLTVEVVFSGWQPANGIEVPSRIQKFVGGTLALDLSNVSVSVNLGMLSSDFNISRAQ